MKAMKVHEALYLIYIKIITSIGKRLKAQI